MEADPFIQSFDSSDLQIAKEFLTNWLPFLTKDLCEGCEASILDRIQSLSPDELNRVDPQAEEVDGGVEESGLDAGEESSGVTRGVDDYFEASTDGWEHIKATGWDTDPATESPKVRMSWADELEEEEEEEARKNSLEDGIEEVKGEVRLKKTELSRGQRERIRFTSVGRKKDFVCLERIDGRIVNILEGVELHTGVFSAVEQKKIVDFVYELQVKGRNNELGDNTYPKEPDSINYMRRKGCSTIQFGCCYNHEQNENLSGILCNAAADPIPNLFKLMIKRLIGWHVMPISCVPDSCSVNIYEPSYSVQPNIESHDFVRPFCTVSFLSECSIIFGFNLKVADAGEVKGSTPIPLPVGSVLVLNGKGANVAKHWVPAVPSKRISITFRKMDESKRPHGFWLEPDLQNIRPYDLGAESYSENKKKESFVEIRTIGRGKKFNERFNNGAKVGRNFRKDGAFIFDRITPTKKYLDVRNAKSFFESEYEVGLQNHPDEAKEEEVHERSKGGRNFRKDGASIFDRITPTKKYLDVRNAKSFFESEYEAGLQNHPDEDEEEEVHERSKGGRNFRKDGASIFDRITPTKKYLDVRNAKSFFESEYEAGLQNHPDEVEEEEVHERSHHGWNNEEGDSHLDRNKFPSERSVRMEQKRIVITRNLDGEDESFSRRSPEFNSGHSPQVRIRTLKNNQRRVRMNH